MRRILIISGKLYIGGAEKVSRDIGLYSDPSQFEIHYIVFGNQIGEYEQELLEHGCKIIHMDEPSKSYFRYVRKLVTIMKHYRYAAVHAHTMFNSGWIMLAARIAGVPIRISHSHSALKNGSSVKKQLYESLMRFMILSFSTDLVACGEAAGLRLFGEKAYRKKGQLILNGIDTKAFAFSQSARDQIRDRFGLQDAFVIGHAGHLSRVKNQSFLIRLMPAILERNPKAKLMMLGEGDARPMLEQIIRELRLSDHVILTGNVRNVSEYLCAMDVFAFPSLFEGMPLSILEVQANGLPCVLSTEVPRDVYLSDLIKPLPLDKPDQWIESICSLKRCESEKYSFLLRKSGFDTEEVMNKFFQIYERADVD